MSLPLGQVLTSSQVAEILHCSSRTVEDHARSGALPGYRFGDGWVFVSDLVIDALRDLSRAEAASRKTPKPKIDPITIANTSKSKRAPAGMESMTESERASILKRVNPIAH